MSDSTPPTNTPQGQSSHVATNNASGSTTKSNEGQNNRSKKSVPKLNPDAKDYVPRAPAPAATAEASSSSGGAGTASSNATTTNAKSGGESGPERQNRKKRNHENAKPSNGNSGNNGTNDEASPPNKASENSQDGANGNSNRGGEGGGRRKGKGNNNSNATDGTSNRNRRTPNRGNNTKQPVEGGARIDDDPNGAAETTSDHPVESTEGSAVKSGSNGVGKGRRHDREGRNKGKETSQSSSSRPQQPKGDKGRSAATATDGQAESSSSANNNVSNNNRGGRNGDRRPKNRRGGDLNGRTFPTAAGGSEQTEEASGSQRTAQRKTPRVQSRRPKRNADEDRDLMAKLTEGLTNSTYECMVCWEVVRPAHKIWNCQVCWAAFHLDCLSTWATKSSEEKLDQKCYCGKHERQARCGDGEPKSTLIDGELQTGFYECHEVCHQPLACGNHDCTKTCHPLDGEPGQCPARPEVIKTCPCGSKSIEILLKGKSRTSCTDPIPVCGGLCKKNLDCGHRCMQKCHLGACPPCLRACGKHECSTRCCPAKNKPKNKKGDLAALEAHICPLVCGKKLKCGVHTCDMLCHKGHCDPCLGAILRMWSNGEKSTNSMWNPYSQV
ncbi:FKBP12-associated protein [Mortierella sp. NVP85]|nr:FKBP12-associated protein [Mortierella sp. NVP85]